MGSDILIEICCSDIYSVQLAQEYGADAIELCVDLKYGGLTPSAGFIRKARQLFDREMAVFFRPRNGHFIYSASEKDIILYDIQFALDTGVDTIVAGALTENMELDIPFLEDVIDISRGSSIVFHRAIDIVSDPEQTILQLIDLHIDRILSSGRSSDAFHGIDTLKKWNSLYGNQIQFMAAGGIDHSNVSAILNESGLLRFHASLRESQRKESNPVMDLAHAERIDELKLKKLMQTFKR
jgi:copper homeostasis protein